MVLLMGTSKSSHFVIPAPDYPIRGGGGDGIFRGALILVSNLNVKLAHRDPIPLSRWERDGERGTA